MSERESHGEMHWSRWGDPAEIGPTCVYFAAPASGFVTGCVLPVDGGLSSYMGIP